MATTNLISTRSAQRGDSPHRPERPRLAPTAGSVPQRRCPRPAIGALAALAAAALVFATTPRTASPATAATTVSGYGWPVKPFNREHAIRGNFGDPRTVFLTPPTPDGVLTGKGSFSFHQGVDVAAPNGTAVYPVRSGTVTAVTPIWVRVASDGGETFEYWHITPAVHVGDRVTVDKTVLGRILKPAGHVHLTQYENGHVVNPLVPGRLGPYHDTTKPVVESIALRRSDSGRDLLASFVRGRIEMLVDAYDMPTMRVKGEWAGLPVTPALLTWRIQRWTGRVAIPERVAADFRSTVPDNAAFWRIYARGTYQNMAVFGKHYSYLQRGCYLFRLTPKPFDTSQLRDGVYDLVVTATDIRGNRSSQTLRFTVHNRAGWIGS
jgi:Peptidase family M23